MALDDTEGCEKKMMMEEEEDDTRDGKKTQMFTPAKGIWQVTAEREREDKDAQGVLLTGTTRILRD